MADTADQLTAKIKSLRDSRDAGVLFVRNGDLITHFRSLAEMNALIQDLETQLAALNSTTPKSRVRYLIQRDKGF